MDEAPPIRWVDDVSAAAWWTGRLDGSYDLVSAIMPAGFEAYARLIHPPDAREPGSLPLAEARALIDLLRAEPGAGRCWFGVPDGGSRIDTQGVMGRVSLPSGGVQYLLYAGSIDQAIAAAPVRRIGADMVMEPGLTVKKIARRLKRQAGPGRVFMFHQDATPQDIVAALANQPAVLPEAAASIWWPDDRAWFVVTADDLATTYLGGSRRLIDRLRADPRLTMRPAEVGESLHDAEYDARERQYGPVIANGFQGGYGWVLRGRIGDDGAWSWFESDRGGGGGGPRTLPFEDIGGKTMGHFGGLACSGDWPVFLHGLVSRQVATVDVQLASGDAARAQIVDVGSRRASFFVASWPSGGWRAIVARDAAGKMLETYSPHR